MNVTMPNHKRFLAATLLITVGFLASGCASKGFGVRNLAKSDMSYVADTSMAETELLLRELADKLYKRNPRELKKGTEPDASIKVGQIFAWPGQRLQFAELDRTEEIDAIRMGLDPDFEGDRVFAVMVGLTGMLRRSYGYQHEYFMFDSLDAQALYNSARNMEVLLWRLKNRRDADGRLLLLTNSRPDEPTNISYERLFGKLIGMQDLMAKMAEDRSNRTITKAVQTAASAVFLPLP